MRPLVIPFRLVFARITTDVGFGHNNYMKEASVLREEPILLSPRSRFRAAMILAMAADALQIFVFPLFAEGALSPADDVLDLAVAIVLVNLLGWHWEFLPAAPENHDEPAFVWDDLASCPYSPRARICQIA